jgi:hypothetical protein
VELYLASGLGRLDSAAVADVERDAVGLTVWDMRHVTGLLQTEDYARAQLSMGLPPDDVERELRVRMARQQILNGLLYGWFILDEAALHRGHGGPEVMRGQLAHLEEVAALPNITIQVLPFSDSSHPGGDAPSTLVEYQDKPSVWLTEGRSSGKISSDHAEVMQATLVLNQLRAAALTPRESHEFLKKAREARSGLAEVQLQQQRRRAVRRVRDRHGRLSTDPGHNQPRRLHANHQRQRLVEVHQRYQVATPGQDQPMTSSRRGLRLSRSVKFPALHRCVFSGYLASPSARRRHCRAPRLGTGRGLAR